MVGETSLFHSSSLGWAASSANALVPSLAGTLSGLENLVISAASYPPLQKERKSGAPTLVAISAKSKAGATPPSRVVSSLKGIDMAPRSLLMIFVLLASLH